uniref:STI1 domain-containing protein n=1 Tax=Chromera velia CCMP2878 TaxID=1169474 RepID=A0A0G4HL24_9ALVE|eukprot:Cvel_28605.t1-p1 / transcript=Cvel_28605.t1 / gene=Cvel_28605 / organism=Chromera_velia_CCMP2878 / gene_product=hypothetical protein / transcript_product=hypothetical protein / location=Cvel_scaffold3773:5874-7593(+) / protein_length=255 / sequence_SO=supercontig / SO=protein_coding / is_pseudo=false
MSADDCSEPPPLEDMSEMLNKMRMSNPSPSVNPASNSLSAKSTQQQQCQKETPEQSGVKAKDQQAAPSSLKKEGPKIIEVLPEKKKEEKTEQPKKKSSSAFGMRKGFLSGGSRESKPKEKKKETDITPKITYIAPKRDAKPGLQLPEVQAAMNAQIGHIREGSWVTPDLQRNLVNNPALLQGFCNPKVQDFIALAQKDPDAAKAKYRDDPEVQSFYTQFAGMMGNHFGKLAEQEEAQAKQAQKEQAVENRRNFLG